MNRLLEFARQIVQQLYREREPVKMPHTPLQQEQADAIRLAIEELLEDVRKGTWYSRFDHEVAQRWTGVWSERDIQDPFLNAVWRFAFKVYDERRFNLEHSQEPHLIWGDAPPVDTIDMLRRIVAHLERYERMDDPYLMSFYRRPRCRRDATSNSTEQKTLDDPSK